MDNSPTHIDTLIYLLQWVTERGIYAAVAVVISPLALLVVYTNNNDNTLFFVFLCVSFYLRMVDPTIFTFYESMDFWIERVQEKGM